MRISTEALTECIGVLAGLDGVDAGSLAGDEAMAWLAAGGRARQSLDAVLAALTSRIEELSQADDRGNRFARRKGFSNAAALVTEVAQVPRSDAGRLVSLGQAMSDADAGSAEPLTLGAAAESGGPLPLYAHLAQAMARGFSAEKAALIRRVLKAMTAGVATVEIERSLVERARKRTVEQVRVICMNEFARIDSEGYLRFQRVQRTQRSLKFWDSDDGMFNIHGKLDAVAAIPLRTWLEDDVRKALHNQRGMHPSEQVEPEQLAADALAELALHRLGCQDDASGPKSTIVIQVTEEALAAGTGMARCHGYSAPISVELLPQIAVDAQRMTAVMGSEGLPLYLGRAQRLFTPAQRLAIALRDGGCARCGAPVARCHVHHIKWWSDDGPTDIDNGVLLCSGCHHRLHDFGWEIDVIAGEVWFVPPAEVDAKRERIPACSTRLTPQPA
jgi:5-methylcytosine-specific restriction protein A